MNHLDILVINFINAIIDALVCFIYFRITLGRTKKINSFLLILAFTAMEALLVVNTLLNRWYSGPIYNIYCIIISLISIFLISLLYNSTITSRIIFVTLFQILFMIAEILGTYISEYASKSSVFYENDDISINIFLSKIIMCLFITLLNVFYKKSDTIMLTTTHKILMFLFPCTTFITIIRLWPTGINETSQKEAIDVILCGLLSIVTLLHYFLINSIAESITTANNNRIKDQQLMLQQTNYENIIEAFKKLRSLLHDTKKHDLYIRECVKNHKYEELNVYLNSTLGELNPAILPVNSGNISIDAMVHNCVMQCSQKNIKIDYEIALENPNMPIDNLETNVILGNMLDNAVNAASLCAARDNPFILLKIINSEKLLFIQVKNLFSKEEENSKPHNIFHGYGINNTKDLILKHNGTYSYSNDGDIFVSTITIPSKTE